MKVLVLNNRYPSEQKPFVASYVKSIAQLIEETHKVDLLVQKRNSSGKIQLLLDLALYNLDVRFSSKFDKTEVIFANHFNLYWSSLRKRVKPHHKLIIHWHGSELFGSKRFRNFSKWRKDEKFLGASHIVPSEYFKKQVLKEFPEIGKINLIPSGGIDTNIFRPSRQQRKEGEICVGFASHLNMEKGADYLLELAEREKALEKELDVNLRFLALDYGAKNPLIPEKLKSSGVTILPPFSKNEMPDFYNSLDILIFPTKRKSESLGLVPLEAMACGVPVLCPDAFACPEYCIPGISGELYISGDLGDFIKKIATALTRIGSYSPRAVIVDNYSTKVVREQYDQLITSIGGR